MSKETVANMIEKGFYTGAAATVGIICVAAAPEVAAAVVLGVVAYKAVDRTCDTFKDFKAFCKSRRES